MILTLTNNSNTIYLDTGLIAFVFADGGNTYITLNTEPIEAVRIDPALSGVLFDNSGLYGVQTIQVTQTYSAIKTACTGYGFGEFTHAAYTNVWVNCVAVHRVLSVGGNAKLLFRRIADVQTTTTVSTALTTISTATASGGGSGITQLTGDVTAGPGSGSQAATIANSAVTNAKMANMAGLTLKGNNTSSPSAPADLTPTQVTALLTLGGLSITGGAITSSDTLIGALGKLQNQINLIMTVPTNSVAPVISGSLPIGSTLSSTTGTWSAIGPITYTYQWRRGASNITGAISSTYVTVSADAGQNITCRVTATTPVGSANADSNISVPTNYDADAQAFITAAGITDLTQQGAINTLVVDLKGYSIWTKMKAIYPIVGGTASSHAVNLKTPGTYNLTFASGMTHSSTGMVGNGTTGYGNSNLTPSTALTLNSTHISFYSRTSTITNGQRDMGAYPNGDLPCVALGTNTGVEISDHYDFNQRISASIASANGFYNGLRTTSTSHKLFRNGTQIGVNTNINTQSLPNINIFICGINTAPLGIQYSTKQCAFASIGDGLTDTEAANFYTAVQAYQTTLGRQV